MTAPSVFESPTPEMVDVSHGLGIPFGGIGTGYSVFGKYGFVDVCFDGRTVSSRDWRVDRAPKTKPTFAFQITEGDKTTVLQETPVEWLTSAQPVNKVRAYADLPKGHFVFEKADTNLGLSMTAFSPMVPHDLANSTIPVQIFDLAIQNKADQPRTVDLGLLHQAALEVRNNKAVLVEAKGETAFACEHGVATTHGVSTSLKLKPNQTQTVRFYIAWNYPAIKTTSGKADEVYRRYYTKRFAKAEQSIDLASKSADEWSGDIDRWHASFDVPPALKRLWFSALCSVSTSTILTDNPFFFEQEVPHGWVNTMDVSVYHNWLYLVNWPEIERMDMNQYYQSIATTGDKAGLVWHSLWSDASEYAEEPTFIGRMYRDSIWFNDKAWTAKGFTIANIAANHAYQTDVYQYLPHNRRGNQSYDLWSMPGVNAYVSVMWVYALYSLDQMSKTLDQPSTVGGMPAGELLGKARESLDKLLWNTDGHYWNAFFVPKDRPEDARALNRTDGIDTFSDQLFGKWLCLIDPNAETVLPTEKVNAALNTIYTNNLVDDPDNAFRGWSNGMRPGHQPEMNAGTHARTCWFGSQETLAALFADSGDEAKSLDVFNSLESSLHNNHLFVGEWNKSVGPDGKSRILPEEPAKDTPRFPPYPRYKSGWQYLMSILGMKMDAQSFYFKPFKTIGFQLHDIELAGAKFTIAVQPGWTKVFVNGVAQTVAADSSLQIPRSGNVNKIEFVK